MTEQMDPVDDKYIVFKRSDWDEAIKARLGEVADDLERLYRLPDAIALRLQDVFVLQALFQYSNTVTTVAEILDAIGDGVLDEEVAQLQQIADRFADFGAIGMKMTERKFPD